jgi:hypothetical protein
MLSLPNSVEDIIKEKVKEIPTDKIPLSMGLNVVCGKSMSGKTYALRKILEAKRNKIATYIVFSYNRATIADWRRWFQQQNLADRSKVYPSLDPAIIDQVQDYQQRLITEGMTPAPICIILDDILVSGGGKKRLQNEDIFNHLAFNSRHYHLINVVLVQDIVGLSRAQLSNAGTTLLFSTDDFYLRENHYFPKLLYSALWVFGAENYKGKAVRNQIAHRVFDSLERFEFLAFFRNNQNRTTMYRGKATGPQ